jgi:hypothetical protein
LQGRAVHLEDLEAAPSHNLPKKPQDGDLGGRRSWGQSGGARNCVSGIPSETDRCAKDYRQEADKSCDWRWHAKSRLGARPRCNCQKHRGWAPGPDRPSTAEDHNSSRCPSTLGYRISGLNQQSSARFGGTCLNSKPSGTSPEPSTRLRRFHASLDLAVNGFRCPARCRCGQLFLWHRS